MKENVEYNYTKNDLIKDPQKYQMTPFEGANFLKKYEKSRRIIIKKIEEKNNCSSIEEIINENNNYIFDGKKPIPTKDFLKFSIKNINHFDSEHKIENIINTLIKKFEIKKIIFIKYDKNLNEMLDNFKNLTNYLLLSILCLKLYKKNKNLKYLNATLKLNDTVISQFNIISNINNFILLNYCLTDELNEIKKLKKMKGVF